MIYSQYIFAILFLILLGAVAANAGKSDMKKAIVRVVFWGTAAMAISVFVGHLFGVSVG
jgi:VIT1/CCC1 family predicted Fe2+/Mn2+ transporter